MELDFGISRKIFLDVATGWYDFSKRGSNLVSAKDISIPHIQGRYRLNACDNAKRVQEFFFDLEWSSFTPHGEKVDLVTRELVDYYFPQLREAAFQVLDIVLPFIQKQYVYIRASGTGLHIIFFLEGLQEGDWEAITQFIIVKSCLPNTKHASSLVFGLDADTIISSDRKISEFGSWNKWKKDFKHEVDYLNFATFLTPDELFLAEHYPFCPKFEAVRYPERYRSFPAPERLLTEAKRLPPADSPIQRKQSTSLPTAQKRIVVPFEGDIPLDDPASKVRRCSAYWNILRSRDTEWYERPFLVKHLIYVLKLTEQEILKLIDTYRCWDDYDPKITRFYVRKHFREGSSNSKVKKAPRIETLVKYGLCEKGHVCEFHK